MSKYSKRKKADCKKNRRKKLKAKPSLASQETANPPWKKRVHLSWKAFCWTISALASLIGIISVVFLLPKVEVQPGASFDSKNPMDTRFFLQNLSILPIYNVKYIPFYKDGYDYKNRNLAANFIMNNPIKEVAPNSKCSLNVKPLDPPPPFMLNSKSVSMGIMIIYTPKFWMKNKVETFLFWAKPDKDGNYQWCPAGIYENKTDKDLSFMTNLPSLMPQSLTQ